MSKAWKFLIIVSAIIGNAGLVHSVQIPDIVLPEKEFAIPMLAFIDGYVYGESDRKIESMEALAEPANVVASGYMKFKATMLPSDISDYLYYKWAAPKGSLSSTGGMGSDYLEVKWDAPNEGDQNVDLTLEVQIVEGGPTLCTETVKLKTIRPCVVRVKFVDVCFDEEQQIYNGGDPEFDAIRTATPTSLPVCYVKGKRIKTQVDLAGKPDSDLVNNLTQKTPIKVSATALYDGIKNQFDEASIDDNTMAWSYRDYSTVEIASDDSVPDSVMEYEDFKMQWIFKVKNSSGNWIIAYPEGGGYSQETIHKQEDGGRTYGFYLTYDVNRFTDSADFGKKALDYACEWAKGKSTKDSILEAFLKGFEDAKYKYGLGGNCWWLAKDFDHVCKALGIDSKMHRWASAPNFKASTSWNPWDMYRMYPKKFDPVGDMTWTGFQRMFGKGTKDADGWGYHEFVEANGAIYDPSAGCKQVGYWGAYEDKCFDKYLRIVTTTPWSLQWDKNQNGQSLGCEREGDDRCRHTDNHQWPTWCGNFVGPPYGLDY